MPRSAAATPSPRRRLPLAERRALPPGPISCPDCGRCLSHTCAGGTRCPATQQPHVTARYCRGLEKTGLSEADLERLEATLFDEPGGFTAEEMARLAPVFDRAVAELEREDLAAAAKRGTAQLLQTIAEEVAEQASGGTDAPADPAPSATPSAVEEMAPPATAGDASRFTHTARVAAIRTGDAALYAYAGVDLTDTTYMRDALPQARRVYAEVFGERLLLGTFDDDAYAHMTTRIYGILGTLPPAPILLIAGADQAPEIMLVWSPTPDDRGYYLTVERPPSYLTHEPHADARRLSAAITLLKRLGPEVLHRA